MSFCRMCGHQLSDEEKFCSYCGTQSVRNQGLSGQKTTQATAQVSGGNKTETIGSKSVDSRPAMRAMVCEMCGNNDLIKSDGLYVCQFCGTKYTVEEARKLLGVVKIDRTEDTEKLLVLARRAREDNNSENAEKYYSMVLQETPDNWEAVFFQVYYQAKQCKIAGIEKAAYSISNNVDSTMKLILELKDTEEKNKALDMVISYSISIVSMLTNATMKHYKGIKENGGGLLQQMDKCGKRLLAIVSIYDMLETSFKSYFVADMDRIVRIQKTKLEFISSNEVFFNKTAREQEITRLGNEIKAKDPTFAMPSSKKFIERVIKVIGPP